MQVIKLLIMMVKMCSGQVIVPDGYNKAFRPETKDGGPLQISYSMKINGIQDIDYTTMTVKVLMYLRVSWTDERLIFPEELMASIQKNEDSISLQTDILDRIWKPDHFFRLIHEIKEFKLLQTFMGVKLFQSKRVLTSSMHEVEFSCPMNFQDYPFDVQVCPMILGSYFHTIKEVNFTWHKLGLTVDESVKRQLADYEFSLTKINETVCLCFSCFPEKTPCIQILIRLKRNYLVYILGYFVPSSLFIVVAWTSFFWPAHVIPGRTVLTITSLLTVSSMYASSRNDGPQTSYVKAMDAWLLFAIFSAVLCLFQYAVVLQWIKRRDALSVKVVHPMVSGVSSVEREDLKSKYELYYWRTELVGRIGLPILYLIFNMIYWPFFF